METSIVTSPDRGVAPVISTILLVGIVVILAAIISVFALGLGEDVSDPAPSAAFEVDVTEDGTVLVGHIGGETIDGENLALRGGEIADRPETIQAGSTIEITGPTSEMDLVWETDGSSAILSSLTVDLDALPILLGESGFSTETILEEERQLAPGDSIELAFNEDTELRFTAEATDATGGFGTVEAERECAAGDRLEISNDSGDEITVSFDSVETGDVSGNPECGDESLGS